MRRSSSSSVSTTTTRRATRASTARSTARSVTRAASAAAAAAAAAANANSNVEEEQGYGYFDNSEFRTGSNEHYSEDEIMKLEDNAVATRQFIDKTAGPLVIQPIDDDMEQRAINGIILYLLENGDIKALASKSESATSPKNHRSELEIHGTSWAIQNSQPQAYRVAITGYGRRVMERIGLDVADSDDAVGADGNQSELYNINWKKMPPTKKPVGASGERKKAKSAAMAMNKHCDQNTQRDRKHPTARSVDSIGPDANLDRILCQVWRDEDGNEHTHEICTISDVIPSNHRYFLTHRGAGRAHVGRSKYKGNDTILVIMHRSWVNEENKDKERIIFVRDRVFHSMDAHDSFIKMVDPADKTNQLPSGCNHLSILLQELVEANLKLKEYVEGRSLYDRACMTVRNHSPCPNDFNILCSRVGCSQNANALDLRLHQGRDHDLSGPALHAYLQSDYNKEHITKHRALCGDCAKDIKDETLVVVDICMECCLHCRLGNLVYCGNCRDYRCVGYIDNGTKKYQCSDGEVGVKLDSSNIAAHYGICKKCYNFKQCLHRQAEISKKRAETNQDEKDDLEVKRMRNMFELCNADFRKRKENKQYIRGEQSINWDAVCHEDTGYDHLKGCDRKQMESMFRNFKSTKRIKSLEDFDAYIEKGGKVGHAAKVQAGKNSSGKKGQKSRR